MQQQQRQQHVCKISNQQNQQVTERTSRSIKLHACVSYILAFVRSFVYLINARHISLHICHTLASCSFTCADSSLRFCLCSSRSAAADSGSTTAGAQPSAPRGVPHPTSRGSTTMCDLHHQKATGQLRPRPPSSRATRFFQAVALITAVVFVSYFTPFHLLSISYLRSITPYIALSLTALVSVLAYRTLTFPNHQLQASSIPLPATHAAAVAYFNSHRDDVCQRLSTAITIPTVSHDDLTRVDHTHLLKLHTHLRTSFPLVHTHLHHTTINTHSLLYTWHPPSSQANPPSLPILFLAHLDVVPAPDEQWRHPPFSGERSGGRIYGRGSIDNKNNLIAQLQSVEYLLSIGYRPTRSIYFAYGHDEETGGLEGAQRIADRLKSDGIKFEYCLDEGLFIINRIIPHYPHPVALISVAEKGFASAEVSVAVEASEAGHSAVPGDVSAIGILGRALDRLQRMKSPSYFGTNDRALMEWLAHGFPLPMRVLVSNLWLFAPLLRLVMASKPQTAATVRTTTALTIVKAGEKANVVPTHAAAIVNHRIHPNDSIAGILAYDRAIIADNRITVAARGPSNEPSPISSTASRGFRCLHESVLAVYPKVSVSPSVMVAGTDSKWYLGLCDGVYRFSCTYMDSPAETAMFHGRDESISEVTSRTACSHTVICCVDCC